MTNFDLGSIEGVQYGFTDAALFGDSILFIASAEDSPNTVDDGRVLGSLVGAIDGSVVRTTELMSDETHPPMKIEGLALTADEEQPPGVLRAMIVVDPDSISNPALLCEVELRGFR